jgi:hypothetical protein
VTMNAWRVCGVCGKLLGWRTSELHDSTKRRILNRHTSQHAFNTAELPDGGAEFQQCVLVCQWVEAHLFEDGRTLKRSLPLHRNL